MWIYIVVIGAAASITLFLLGRYTAQTGISREAGTATPFPPKSIAVLPFENLSRDPDNAYFAEGVQGEIITRLAKIADLKVISRTSTQGFKSSDNLQQIGKQLGVANILEGSVQKAADQVRVNVQLVNAATDAHLWAESFDRKLTDIFAVESEIASTVANTLQAKLTDTNQTKDSTIYSNDSLRVVVYPYFCNDGMSDFIYTNKVKVYYKGQAYKGCGQKF